jgi:hypothetical protein
MSAFVVHLYVDTSHVRRSIRKASLEPDTITREEQLEQWHTASVFMSKVFSACRDKGVHPHDQEHGIVVDDLMVEAEQETGVFVSEDKLALMNRFTRSRTKDATRRRRAFAYSLFIRVTSGGIVR